MFKWIQLALEQWKTVMSILVLLGVSGVSIYGNVNELNPWSSINKLIENKPSESDIPIQQTKIIERTIETRIESGITKLQVDAAVEAFMIEHIREYH